ncbi:MAG: 2-C-methyl-D-erythritol 2,4-cyclodiphosphate synthase [Candidatus Cloacimonetes bacterium]|nr:2-C-methyl-D-erythritol 2,4-cyclodiphosphate synthase [Candidatus Cloacimonadota bacterium]
MRIGHGYDVHRLEEGRRLVLGGVSIPFERGLLGHSDADVLIHALIDALLGALALGDIGAHFPDTDGRYAGIDSRKLLRQAVALVHGKGWSVGNVDVTVCAEAPRLSPYIGQMRRHLADDFGVSLDAVSVKATTEEGLGVTGQGAGIAATAVALLVRVGE